jgi:hypothetical protein
MKGREARMLQEAAAERASGDWITAATTDGEIELLRRQMARIVRERLGGVWPRFGPIKPRRSQAAGKAEQEQRESESEHQPVRLYEAMRKQARRERQRALQDIARLHALGCPLTVEELSPETLAPSAPPALADLRNALYGVEDELRDETDPRARIALVMDAQALRGQIGEREEAGEPDEPEFTISGPALKYRRWAAPLELSELLDVETAALIERHRPRLNLSGRSPGSARDRADRDRRQAAHPRAGGPGRSDWTGPTSYVYRPQPGEPGYDPEAAPGDSLGV